MSLGPGEQRDPVSAASAGTRPPGWGAGGRAPKSLPATFTHPALLLLLLGVRVLAAADAGVAGGAVEARDAV